MPNIDDFVVTRAALSRALGAAQEAVEQIDRLPNCNMIDPVLYGELIETADELRDRLFDAIRLPMDYD